MSDSTAVLLAGHVLNRLRDLPDGIARCVVTSPPYWGLRDYNTEPVTWPDGTVCSFGLEPTPELYVRHAVLIFREVRRVLSNDGTLWLNIGDSYAGSGKGGNPDAGKQATNRGSQSVGTLYGEIGNTACHAAVTNVTRLTFPGSGIKAKDLVGIPWMLAFALRADGWYLRSEIIWHKPNPMPESVTDRPTKAHETVFLLSKSARYFYDAAAIAEPSVTDRPELLEFGERPYIGGTGHMPDRRRRKSVKRGGFNGKTEDMPGRNAFRAVTDTRNKRSVWTIATQPFRGAHFATFPEKLVEPCVLAGSALGDTILDPFAGSCVSGIVALRRGRNFIGVELSTQYARIAVERVAKSGVGELLL